MALLNNISSSRRNFNPLSLAPALWLSDTGSDPAQWDDISGNNRHATQATVANQPDIIANALNGRQVRRFNGTSDRLTGPNLGSVENLTTFVVSVHTGVTTNVGLRIALCLNLYWDGTSLDKRLLSQSTSSTDAILSNIDNNPSITSGIMTNGSKNKATLDGGSQVMSVGNVSSMASSSIFIGCYSNLSFFWQGDIAEILVFPTALSPQDRRKVEKYLSDKWAITIPTVDEFYIQSLAPALWLDASDPNTLFDSVTGGNLVGADGPVARWEDKSGNGRHATQSTADKQPKRKLAEMGGKDALYFDGGDGIVVPAFTNAGTFTIFSVWKASAGLMVYEWGTTFNTLGDVYFIAGTGSTFSHWSTTTSTYIYSARDGASSSWAKDNTPRIITHYGDGTHAGHNARVNGVLPNWTVVKTDDPGTTSRSNPFNIGSRNNAGSAWITGHIAEIIIVPSKLSNTVYQNIEKYLSNKWNVPVYDPDAENYFARITAAGSSITDQNKLAVDAFIKGCKADNNWFAIKACCLLAGADTLSGALVPLVGPAPINYNFVSADYSRTTGLSGSNFAAGKRLNPQRFSGADPQNNSSLSVWVTNASQLLDLDVLIGAGSGTQSGTTHIRNRGVGGGQIEFRNRSGAGGSTTAWTKTGFLGMNRNSQSQFTARFNSTNTNITNESTSPDYSHLVFGATVGAPSGYNAIANVRLAFYHFGTNLNLALLEARLATYMSSLL